MIQLGLKQASNAQAQAHWTGSQATLSGTIPENITCPGTLCVIQSAARPSLQAPRLLHPVTFLKNTSDSLAP